jgi:demethylmenaquinone methyltransferase/2-methoxy-6-polyprenyl-1,4-benzoquinol methylase
MSRAAWIRRVLRAGGRIAVVGMSKKGEHGLVYAAYDWTHHHFPNFVDCRPIFVSKALEASGFQVEERQNAQMWVPVEIVRAVLPSGP